MARRGPYSPDYGDDYEDGYGDPVAPSQAPAPSPVPPNYLQTAANEAYNPFASSTTPPPATMKPTRRLGPNERPAGPTGGVWNDDWWDGRSDYLGGYLIPEGAPYGGERKKIDMGGGGDTGDRSGFEWPRFDAPNYRPGAPFAGPSTPFSYEPFSYGNFSFDAFKAPKPSEIFDDPSFVQRRDEGTTAIEHGAAAKGLTRLPQTLQALAGWNQNFASREFDNVFDRAGQSYDRNRGNAFGNWSANRENAFGNWQGNRNNAADAYSLNYGVSRDVWDRGENQNLNAFDRNYTGAKDKFDFNQFRPSQETFRDLYNRWKTGVDSTTQIAVGGNT